jgi:hypothetical protein
MIYPNEMEKSNVRIQVLPANANGTARLSSNLKRVVDASAIVASREPMMQIAKKCKE